MDYPPTVTANPAANETVNAGNTATFTAAASGNPTPTVQWQVSSNGGATFTAISGATSPTYSFTANSSENTYQYEAVFSNGIGTAATTTASTLTVDYVKTEPASQTVVAGNTATLTAASSNPGGADTVQWKVSSDSGQTFTAISGATSPTYTFTATPSENGDQYEAVFSNTAGTLTSTPATLTVNYPPTVTTNPTAQTADAGGTATFTAAASGNPTPTVQWQVSTNGGQAFTPISGATSATYSFRAATAENGYLYEAVFSNGIGTAATTTAAALTVDYVTTQPTSQTLNVGQNASFTAGTVNPGGADTVQWQVSSDGGKTFTAISGATSATYTFPTTSAQNSDQYEAVFKNAAGTLTSNPATLTLDYVSTEPSNQSVVAGNAATFTVASSNPGGTDKVQWQVSSDGGKTFTAVSGATSTTYTFTAASAENANQYEAVFTNSLGSFTSSPATLTVGYAPAVTGSPQAQSVVTGGAVTFTAKASGNPAPTVQWQVSSDGGKTFAPISGATSTTYNFTATSAENGNQYEAVFTNTFGSVTATAASLSVQPWSVAADKAAVNATTGKTAGFTITSVGSGTYSYSVTSSGGSSTPRPSPVPVPSPRPRKTSPAST